MTDIDWSKAPEGTEGALLTTECNTHHPKIIFALGYHLNGCMIRAVAADDGRKLYATGGFWHWVERPAQEWTGEGLPPVGTVCEVMISNPPVLNFDWEECTISLINYGADGKLQVCTRDHRGDLAIYYPDHDAVYFRPIRTPEQIAAEERESAIYRMKIVAGFTILGECQFSKLYDAGLRFKDDDK